MNCNFHIGQRSKIYIGAVWTILPEVLPEGRVVVISDASVDRLHPDLLAGFETILLGTGETIKTLATVELICRRLIETGADRSTFLLGIGGGIVTDIAGFVASVYMRGVRFGFVSTTLLGQVDASVGGKNGVNVDGYKNMVGIFNQPQFVICDPAMLRTLPDREFRAGLAEALKAGIIADDSGSRRRHVQRGGIRRPKVLTDFHTQRQFRHLRTGKKQSRPKGYVLLSAEGDYIALFWGGGKLAFFVELAVVGNVAFGNHT